jgi:hypothetical protein
MRYIGEFNKAAVLALFLTGAASQANAGAINMDFTTDAATTVIDSDAPDASVINDTKTVAAPSLSATFGIDLTSFGFAGSKLNVTGARSYVPTTLLGGPTAMRLTRAENVGLGVCSRYTSRGCLEDPLGPRVDGAGPNESLKFTIDPALAFAVRYVTFGFTDHTDDVRMRFQTGLGSYIDFDLSKNDDTPYRQCSSHVCTVDIYELVDTAAGLAEGDYVGFNTDAVWDAGQDAIFAYLASSDGFQFIAREGNDNWTIRGAVWVTADPASIPEPASLSLLGAGVMGLGYIGKRRRKNNS